MERTQGQQEGEEGAQGLCPLHSRITSPTTVNSASFCSVLGTARQAGKQAAQKGEGGRGGGQGRCVRLMDAAGRQ